MHDHGADETDGSWAEKGLRTMTTRILVTQEDPAFLERTLETLTLEGFDSSARYTKGRPARLNSSFVIGVLIP